MLLGQELCNTLLRGKTCGKHLCSRVWRHVSGARALQHTLACQEMGGETLMQHSVLARQLKNACLHIPPRTKSRKIDRFIKEVNKNPYPATAQQVCLISHNPDVTGHIRAHPKSPRTCPKSLLNFAQSRCHWAHQGSPKIFPKLPKQFA